jgi:hypothetical protein
MAQLKDVVGVEDEADRAASEAAAAGPGAATRLEVLVPGASAAVALDTAATTATATMGTKKGKLSAELLSFVSSMARKVSATLAIFEVFGNGENSCKKFAGSQNQSVCLKGRQS